jgi:hypothetical protein
VTEDKVFLQWKKQPGFLDFLGRDGGNFVIRAPAAAVQAGWVLAFENQTGCTP